MDQHIYNAWAVFYGLLAAVTVFLNGIVILTFFKVRALLIPGSFPILSLAIADVFLASAVMPLGIAACASGRWIFGAAGCNWYAFMHTTVGLSSILHHAVLALERCLTIYEPMKKHFDRHTMTKTLAFLWSLVSLWSLCPILGWSAYVPEGAGTICSIEWHSNNSSDVVFVVCTFVFFCFLPFVFIAVCYTAIAFHLRKVSKRAKRTWGKNSQITRDGAIVKRKAVTHGAIMVTTVVVTWLPYSMVAFYTLLGNEEEKLSALTYTITGMFAKTSTLVNPIICFFWYRRFREGTKKLCNRAMDFFLRKHRRASNTSQSSKTIWYNGKTISFHRSVIGTSTARTQNDRGGGSYWRFNWRETLTIQ